jgi:hypothetical protein
MADHQDWMERGRVTAAVRRATAWLARIVHDEAVRWTFGVFLTVRLCLSALAIVVITVRPLPVGGHERYITSLGLEPVSSRAEQLLLEVWQRWDVVHYQRIAEQGYTDLESSIFPPLFPAVIKVLAPALGGSYLLAALLACNLSYFAALIIFYKLIRSEYEPEVARRSTLYLSIFPTAFFFLVPYSESLFFLMVMLFFYAARCQRWVAAGVAAGLASLVRFQGLVLVAPLTYEWLRQAGFDLRRAGRLALLIVLATFPAVVFLCFRHLAGYPSPSSVLATQWHTTIGTPWQNFVNVMVRLVSHKASPKDLLDTVITIPFLLLTLASVPKMRASYALYTALTLVIVDSVVYTNTPLMNLPRHWLLLFPTFIFMGVLGKRSYVHRSIVYSSTPLMLFLTGMFVQWLWVA